MKYTSAQMQLVIKEWQNSGLSKKAFCDQKEISYHTFHYWFKQLIGVTSSGFTQVTVQAGERVSGCEIIFPSGARMSFQGEPSSSWLRELLG